jgi:hypothetical protein
LKSTANGGFEVETQPVTPGELLAFLESPVATTQPDRRVFMIQNLSPDLAKIIGWHLGIDPQFFLDYLHAVPSADIPASRDKISPIPWYRIRNVDAELPMLQSQRKHVAHTRFHFVAAREIEFQDGLDERIESDPTRSNFPRVAGLHVPVQRDDAALPPLMLIRNIISALFCRPGGGYEWTVGRTVLFRNFPEPG